MSPRTLYPAEAGMTRRTVYGSACGREVSALRRPQPCSERLCPGFNTLRSPSAILNHVLKQEALHCRLALGPTHYVAGPANKALEAPDSFLIPHKRFRKENGICRSFAEREGSSVIRV